MTPEKYKRLHSATRRLLAALAQQRRLGGWRYDSGSPFGRIVKEARDALELEPVKVGGEEHDNG